MLPPTAMKPVPLVVVNGGVDGTKPGNLSPLVPAIVNPIFAPVLIMPVDPLPLATRVCVLERARVLLRPDRSSVAPPAISNIGEFGIEPPAFSETVPLLIVVLPVYGLLPVKINRPVAPGSATTVRPLPGDPEIAPANV